MSGLKSEKADSQKEENTMKNRRRFGRFETQLKAKYMLKDSSKDWEECTIISMGRKGMGIRFHTREKIDVGSAIRLEVFIPEKSKPTNVQGILKWTMDRGSVLFGGIESNEILDEMKFSKLS